MFPLCRFLAAAAVVAASTQAARAGTVLDLAPSYPDIYVGHITLSYTVSGNRGVLTAWGDSGTYKTSSNMLSPSNKALAASTGSHLFDLSLAIDVSTGKVIAGDSANHLIIQSSTTLYFSSTNATSDFVTSGNSVFGIAFIQQASSTWAALGQKVVIQLSNPNGIKQNGSTTTSPQFGSNFVGNNLAMADNFAVAVPLPSAGWLGLTGLGVVAGLTYRRKTHAEV